MLKKHNTMIRRIVDVCMTALLLCLMAYQVTGETLHEWIGIGMTVLVILHQTLNRKWYGAMFKGKYKSYRMITTVISVLLIISFAFTAFCGMAMSGHAVPFMYGMVKVSFARSMHLSMSHWSFVLMGLHLGLHIPVMFAKLSIVDKIKTAISVVFCIIAGAGLFLFIKNGVPDYLFFQVPFAFLDYEKSGILVFLENILQLTFWGYIGTEIAVLCRNSQRKKEEKKNPLLPVVLIMGAVLLGVIIHMIAGNRDKKGAAGAASFLEEYDFSGKRIIPFCSHGGGRFGQSQTAIAKLAPDADMGEGLSVHYSGGSTLTEDIQAWLDVNGIAR